MILSLCFVIVNAGYTNYLAFSLNVFIIMFIMCILYFKTYALNFSRLTLMYGD